MNSPQILNEMPETIESIDPKEIINDITKHRKAVEETQQLTEAEVLANINIPDSDNPDDDFSEYGYFVSESKYFTQKTVNVKGDDNKKIPIEKSNFVMRILYNIQNGTNNSTRLIYLQRKPRKKNGIPEKKLIEVRANEMKPEAFETILKSYSCTFLGEAYTLKKIFADLMDGEENAVIISMLGWNKEFQIYAFADSLFTLDGQLLKVNPLGIIHHNGKSYYLPAYGVANMTNEEYKSSKAYIFRPGNIGFEIWSSLYYQASGKNALVGMLYTISAVFRDVVFDKLNFFPFLYLFGSPKTGKSSYTRFLLSMFTNNTTGTPLNSSDIGLNREVSDRHNSLAYFKEYTTETDKKHEEVILSGYDGAGRKTGIKSNDTRTKDFPVLSGIIFDGNVMPTKTNILSRMILLTFESDKYTDKQKSAFDKLKSHSDSGFGNVLLEILRMRPDIEQRFKDEFAKATSTIRLAIQQNEAYQQMRVADERILQHTYLLLTIYQLSRQHLVFPFGDNEVMDAIMDIGANMVEKLSQTDAVTVFWQSVSYNISKSFVHELYFTTKGIPANKKTAAYWIKEIPSGEARILIKFQQLYPVYVKYCKDNSIRFLDANSLKSILTSQNNETFIPGNQKGRGKASTDGNFGSCYQFLLEKGKNNDKGTYSINGVEFDR